MSSFAETLAGIRNALSGLTDGGAGMAVLALAAVATVAMAILQIVKEVTPARRWFQCRWMQRWMRTQSHAFDTLHTNETPARKANADVAAQSLVELATGRLAEAFYDLTPEDMMQQANAAGQIMLDEANRYLDLLYVLSEGASERDLGLIEAGLPLSGSTQDYFEARARLTRRVVRNLEGARLAMSNRWKLWMQLAALLLTTLAVEAVVVFSTNDTAVRWLAIPVGLVGGYIAPIARDLVATLQRLRSGAA